MAASLRKYKILLYIQAEFLGFRSGTLVPVPVNLDPKLNFFREAELELILEDGLEEGIEQESKN